MNPADSQELGRQPRLPTGEQGRKLGQKINASNKQKIDKSVQALDLQPRDSVLELGRGAAGHLPHLMQQEARRAGAQLSEQHDLQFELLIHA